MSDPYDDFKEGLENNQFILIIGKFDNNLGPISLYSSIPLKEKDFVTNLLRDALNTKSKHVILNFNRFYSQICKIDIKDKKARGGKQKYAIIFLRDIAHPLIPIDYFSRIEIFFNALDSQKILQNDQESFANFYNTINDIYMKKDEILPLELLNIQIRSRITTIQGFCELILEESDENGISKKTLKKYSEMMHKSCKEIIKSLDEILSKSGIK